MRNAVVILANYMDFLEIMLDNYPSELYNTDLVIINETRIGDKTTEIRTLLNKYSSVVKNSIIITDADINDKFTEVIDNEFVHDYSMSMKLLPLWYLMKFYDYNKLLIMDEDVIINDGINKLFDTDHSLFKHYRMSAGPGEYNQLSKNVISLFEEFGRIFDFTFDADVYKNVYLKNYESAGQKLIIRDDFNLNKYEEKLKKFFESDLIHSFWLRRRVPTSYALDEKFETFFFLDVTNDDLKPSTYLIIGRPENTTDKQYIALKKYAIIHNATRSHKVKVYKRLMNCGLIKHNSIYDNI